MGCQKKVIEIIPVAEYTLRTSGTTNNLKFVTFPSPDVGYIAGDSGTILKSTDGGKSWTDISLPTNTNFSGFEFFTDSIGMYNNTGLYIYITYDGGNTWSNKESASWMDILNDSLAIIVSSSFPNYYVKATYNAGKSFVLKSIISNTDELTRIRLINDHEVVFIFDESLLGLDFENVKYFSIPVENLTWDEKINDAYFIDKDNGIIIGNKGVLLENDGYCYCKEFHGHLYNFNAVDGYYNNIVVVGETTMVAKVDVGNGPEWVDLLDYNGSSLRHKFNGISFRDANTFFVVGNKGLIWELNYGF